MFNLIVTLLLAYSLVVIVSGHPLESDYRKYWRTRKPQAPGEVHVEEVLEVFRTRDRPPSYGVYNGQVNGFLANDAFQKRKGATTTTRKPARTTYPTPTQDNTNPDYSNSVYPSISMTKYPNYPQLRTMIIQERPQSSTLQPETKPGNDDTYQYSNEDYFDQ
ncbi:uncharacterized protein LOC129738957 [Uranotaenia lowii]|uniref:uncharacterized protein LOC129738957 n=1 Tax=Uranotaenia lowii TaxID=190385 RepID=UPI00247994F2|nr:uncharacterized protein LOC129738957 [Uranotaenia lowii]